MNALVTQPAYAVSDLEVMARAFSGAFSPNADGCLEWSRYRNRDGYGVVNFRRKHHLAHRAFYELMLGPIPTGLQLDHLCRNRCCVNPAHLEPVTLVENMRRGNGPSMQNARKTHCSRGHAFTDGNTYREGDKRHCLTCRTANNRRHSAARSAARREIAK